MSDRADAITPTAAALVAAVRDADRDLIDRLLLDPDADLLALAVVLASWAEPGRMPKGATAVLTEAERRAAHAAWERGVRSELVRFGEREYQRTRKRSKRWEAEGAPLDLTLEGRWITQGGVQVWVNDNERETA